MLGKRPTVPMIGKLSELLVSGSHAMSFLDSARSPRGPLDLKAHQQSPRGLKNYDLEGVGLGIVVALDKGSKTRHPSGRKNEVLPKHAVTRGPNPNRSGPIPLHSARRVNDTDAESLEDYTYVTCHVPNKTFTKVYYGGGEVVEIPSRDSGGALITEPPASGEMAEALFPTSSFLSSCNLCTKELHGKDIYMYRGEKAFCSTECRSRQIMMDERKERCSSRTQGELSTSPYTTREHIFSTGILAL